MTYGSFDSITVEGVEGMFQTVVADGQLQLVRVSGTAVTAPTAVATPDAVDDGAASDPAVNTVAIGPSVSSVQSLARTGASVLPEIVAATALVLVGTALVTRRCRARGRR